MTQLLLEEGDLPADRALSVSIDDLSALTTSDYEIDFPGPGDRYAIIRSSDDVVVTQGVIGNNPPHDVSVDGFTLTFESGSFSSSDIGESAYNASYTTSSWSPLHSRSNPNISST